MRLAALTLALLFAGPAMADAVARAGQDTIRLTDGPCIPEVLAFVPEDWKPRMKAASAIIDGKTYRACWGMRNDGAVVVQFDDGDSTAIDPRMFRMEPGV